MRRRQSRIVTVLIHSGAVVLLYLAFSGALYLGLQVEPLYGNIGLAITAVLVAAYVYFGFIRRK
ncbi:MAG: hypothetical protein F4Y86_01235 [Gammaproteobacteria bacterium]|nr:hypothetical protein [Gammaproteobacteria bacterium]